MARSLLKLDAHDGATVSELACAIANEQVGEVLDCYLSLEGHAAAPRRIGMHAPRRRSGAKPVFSFLRTVPLLWSDFAHLDPIHLGRTANMVLTIVLHFSSGDCVPALRLQSVNPHELRPKQTHVVECNYVSIVQIVADSL